MSIKPTLFIIAVEILAIRIRNNPDVRGIQVNEDRNENLQTNTTKIKKFADNTTLTMNNEKDMKLAISIVEQFQEFSRLRLNKRKSEGIWMGSRKHERGRIHDIPVGEWVWGVEGKQVGSMDEEPQVRGCYNITFICTPTNQETVSVLEKTQAN